MSQSPCVLIPTYNNCRTLEAVVRGAAEHAPVIVVDDGSTDATATILAGLAATLDAVTVVTHPHNQGKGRALATGFEHALAAGFSHAISIDSDGQHLTEDIGRFLSATAEQPTALLLGNRDLIAAGAGRGSRFGGAVSNFWTWVETGLRLPDTQTGFRCYPLAAICELALEHTSYDFEIEILVKASWAGTPVASVPIQVRYFEGEERVSHMRPVVEFLRISWLNTKLCTQRCCFPKPYLALRSLRRYRALPLKARMQLSLQELFIREPGSPSRVAASVSLGLFMGIVPLWGFQIALTLILSHLLGASKTVAVIASNISFPLMIPPILYGSLVLGRIALGNEQQVAHWSTLELGAADFWPWVLGSFVLAAATAIVGGGATYLLVKSLRRRPAQTNHPGPSPGRARPLFIALGIVLLSLALGSRVTLDNDVSRLLPDSSPELKRATKALARLMDRTLVDVGAGDSSLSHTDLGRIADQFSERLLASGHVTSARSRVDSAAALDLITLLRQHAAVLTESGQLEAIEAATRRQATITTVQRLAQRIQEPDGAYHQARAGIDPLGITDQVLAPLAAFGESFRGSRILDERITSADGKHILIPVVASFQANDTDRGAEYLRDMQAIIAELGADPANRGLQIRHLGAHRGTLDNVNQIRRDVTLTSSIGVISVALLAILCFGRFWLALLAMTPALFGSVVAWGTFSCFQTDMSGAVLGFGAVLVGLTIDFAIHVLFRVDRSTGDGPVHLPIRALFMGGTTTSLAFVALQGSSLPFVRDVGLFGAVGILAAMLFAIYVLPKTVPIRRTARPFIDLQRVVERASRGGPIAMWLAIAITPVLALGVYWLEFDGNPANLSGLSQAARADEAGIYETWGKADDMTTLVVEGDSIEAALQANDRLADRLKSYRSDGTIREFGSIAGLLPSHATQRARLASWQGFWTAERRQQMSASLRAATDASRFHATAFAPFEALLADQPELLSFQQQRKGPMQAFLDGRVYQEDAQWRVMTPVFTNGMQQTEAFAQRLAREMPAVTLLNKRVFSLRLAAMVTGEVGLLALLAFLMVATVVFLWHGRPLISAAILLPLLLSLLWTLGILGWLGIPISLANAIFVVFLFGVAVDYSIFLASSRLDLFRTGVDRTREAQGSVLLCTLTTCGGFGSLVLAGHPVMHSIGVTALAGLVSAAVATQLFVPVMVRALLRRHGPNGTPRSANLAGGAWALLVLGGGGLWHLLFRRRNGTKLERQTRAITAIRRMMTRLIRTMICGRRRIEDTDSLLDEPSILVANHESMYDLVAILSLPRPTRVLVKDWVWKMPVMGGMVRAAGYIRAGGEPKDIFAAVAAALADGHSVLVFPEGRRSRDGKIGRFHNGAFAMARELGVKVQPLAMVNSRAVVPYQAWWIGDHDTILSCLEPMDPGDYQGEGADRRMARECRDRIRARVAERWPQTQNGPSWSHEVGGMYRYLGPMISHYAVWKCRLDPLIARLPALCSGSGSILVAGGGFGLMTARLALAYPNRPITSVDLDERKLSYARAALGDGFPVQYVETDIRGLPPGEFDLVLAVDILHYWDDPTQRQLLASLVRQIAPGQRLVFREGCTGGKHSHTMIAFFEQLAVRSGFTRNQGQLLFRSETEWRQLLQEAGLEIESSHPELGKDSNLVLVCRRPLGAATLEDGTAAR